MITNLNKKMLTVGCKLKCENGNVWEVWELKGYFGIKNSRTGNSVYEVPNITDLTNRLNKSFLTWTILDDEPMENNNVIKFNDGEYVWEDIPNKGKCLVPYVKPIPQFKVGDYLVCKGEKYLRMISQIGNLFYIVSIGNDEWNLGKVVYNNGNGYSSLEELSKSCYKSYDKVELEIKVK